MLDVTPAALGSQLASNVPAVGAGLIQLPAILTHQSAGRLSSANMANFRRAEAIPTKGTRISLVQAQRVALASVLLLASAAAPARPALLGAGLDRRKWLQVGAE